jgi:1,4-dihydroxy-2-naphthoate octaprenyltransferase
MSYVFLLILLFPVKLIRKLFRKDTGRNLVIQPKSVTLSMQRLYWRICKKAMC